MTRKRHMLVVMPIALMAIGIGGNAASAATTTRFPSRDPIQARRPLPALQPHSSPGQAPPVIWVAVRTKNTSP